MRRASFTIIFISLVLTGCSLLQPKTTALEKVHEIYREEFAQFVMPEPSENPNLAKANANTNTLGFPRTLEAIRAFGVEYGTDSREFAHLIVLKGMIYLQSAQFGIASAMEADVRNAGDQLISGTGHLTRDALLAANFEHLVDGWREIHKFTENTKQRPSDEPKPFPKTNIEIIKEATGKIENYLKKLKQKNPDKLADPEADQGAIYLATAAAAFYTWVQKENNQHCPGKTRPSIPKCTNTRWQNKKTGAFYVKGKDLIGMFLTESEKKAATHDRKMDVGAWVGRARYLDWYGWLSCKIQEQKRPNTSAVSSDPLRSRTSAKWMPEGYGA